MFVQICSILTVIHYSSCAKILVFNPSPSYSHQIAFAQLWEELSLRGHKVTLVTTFPTKNPKLTNLTEINMQHVPDEFGKRVNMSNAVQELDIWGVFKFIKVTSDITAELHLSNKKIQELIRRQKEFDLILVHFWYPELLMLGKIHDCPTILFSSYYFEDYVHYSMGNPTNPVSHPYMVLPFVTHLNFKERLVSVIHSIFRWYTVLYKASSDRQRLIDKYFNFSVPVEDLINAVDLTFISTHPVLQEVRPLGPATITVGYHRQPTSSTPLEEDLKNFLDNAKEGFVYFSLGSNVLSRYLKESNVLGTIMDALKDIPCKFIYKYEDDDLDNKPDNVKLIKWAPQYEVLRHPNIKAFVTQGGFQSMEEAIYNAVPMVVIPFFVDQERNAMLMESKGIAKKVSRKPLKKEELQYAINEVLNNSSYKEKITRLRQLALDVPMTGLEKAIWWIEYVIRNKGAKHLRNPAADVPFYQYFLLDVICFLVIVTSLSLIILYLLITKLFFKLCIRLVEIKIKRD